MKHTLITAHSGCENTPDNSIEAVLAGIRAGADCVEVDVRIGAQGVLMLTHDLPGKGEEPAILEQAFACLQGTNVCINCDLKEYEALLPAEWMLWNEEIGLAARKLEEVSG